eukprot:6212113-Pleurochrysis_carterae.AAC.3
MAQDNMHKPPTMNEPLIMTCVFMRSRSDLQHRVDLLERLVDLVSHLEEGTTLWTGNGDPRGKYVLRQATIDEEDRRDLCRRSRQVGEDASEFRRGAGEVAKKSMGWRSSERR